MPEGANIEVAHALTEGDDDHESPSTRPKLSWRQRLATERRVW